LSKLLVVTEKIEDNCCDRYSNQVLSLYLRSMFSWKWYFISSCQNSIVAVCEWFSFSCSTSRSLRRISKFKFCAIFILALVAFA